MCVREHASSQEIGPDSVKLLVQMKLMDGVSNQFEALQLTLPFFNHGRIREVEANPSIGTVKSERHMRILRALLTCMIVIVNPASRFVNTR